MGRVKTPLIGLEAIAPSFILPRDGGDTEGVATTPLCDLVFHIL